RAVQRTVGGRPRRRYGADVDDTAARGTEVLERLARREDDAEHVEIELLAEILDGDVLEGREFVEAGIVDEDVEGAERLVGLGEQTSDVRFLCHIGMHCDGLSALVGYVAYDMSGVGLARAEVDHHRGALGRKASGDR